MPLKVSDYRAEDDASFITAGDPQNETDEIDHRFDPILSYHSATYRPSSFELVCRASAYLPLDPAHGYDPETDALTFGTGKEKAELVVPNGDRAAHRAYAATDPEPEFYLPIAGDFARPAQRTQPRLS